MTKLGGRYRANGLKLKHHTIQGLRPLLEEVASWEEVSSIIPGRIKNAPSGRGHISLTVQAETRDGLKCQARGNGVQEVFVVTGSPMVVAEKIASLS